MASTITPKVCPEQAKELIMDWLEPLTENGTMDEIFEAFVRELAPIAAETANRVLRRKLHTDLNGEIKRQLRDFLAELLDTIEAAVIEDDYLLLYEQQGPIKEWIRTLDTGAQAPRPQQLLSPEMEVALD